MSDVDFAGDLAQAIGESLRKRGGCRCPVLGVEAIELDGLAVRLDDQGLAVGERPAQRAGHEVIELDARQSRKLSPQLVALAVLATEADRNDPANAEGDKVVEDRPGPARLGADADHVVDGQARLDRGFASCGVDLQVAVQAEITDDRDAQRGVPRRDGSESLGGHAWSAWW